VKVLEERIAAALAKYDRSALTMCSIGSHSALDVASGARARGLHNLVVTARGREQTYARHFAWRGNPPRGCVERTIELGSFAEILRPDVQAILLAANTIFVPNRSFEVYLRQKYSYDEIEHSMLVPFFGNRRLLRAEERDETSSQYALLERAGIRFPQSFASPSEIDRLVMVKAAHAKVSFERAFFLCASPADYAAQSARLLEAGIVTESALASARMEEYALGPSVNLNFFYSPMLGELELLGTDTRRQTNLDGIRSIPPAQIDVAASIPVQMEEAGHIAATLTESMLEKAFDMGERFVHATRELCPPGIIGPFALQCIIAAGPPKEFIVYDVSLRVPGSPGTRYTPYSAYRWGRDVSVGERIAMEVVFARDAGRLADIVT
jgi:5-formaminoimidazole-4-carboxamide-1-(beta)-D-ribofuranosyl 5'-monophosphate synthetase